MLKCTQPKVPSHFFYFFSFQLHFCSPATWQQDASITTTQLSVLQHNYTCKNQPPPNSTNFPCLVQFSKVDTPAFPADFTTHPYKFSRHPLDYSKLYSCSALPPTISNAICNISSFHFSTFGSLQFHYFFQYGPNFNAIPLPTCQDQHHHQPKDPQHSTAPPPSVLQQIEAHDRSRDFYKCPISTDYASRRIHFCKQPSYSCLHTSTCPDDTHCYHQAPLHRHSPKQPTAF